MRGLNKQVLNETVTNNQLNILKNGRHLAQKFFNRTFNADGAEIYIDSVGQRRIDWIASFFDVETGKFSVSS